MKKLTILIAPASLLLAGCDPQAGAPPIEEAAVSHCGDNISSDNESAICPDPDNEVSEENIHE